MRSKSSGVEVVTNIRTRCKAQNPLTVAFMVRVTRRDELLAIAEALERLVLEIRDAADEEPGVDQQPRAFPAVNHQDMDPPPLRRGVRVRVTIRGPYKGRVGTLQGIKGTHFWDILLDAHDGGVPLMIYKKPSSFVVISD